ncbi:MAG: hypothetical protein JSW08_01480 [archaeon]|nr:MAG: hypothetical protein JSW08_01480 [archaeon]
MDIPFTSKWHIKDKQVSSLDDARRELNEDLSVLSYEAFGDPDPCISLTTERRIYRRVKELERKVRESEGRALAPFDTLVLRDIKKNTEMARAYMEFTSGKTWVGSFISGLYGNSSYSKLLVAANKDNFPHEKVDEYNKAIHFMRSRQVDSETLLRSQEPRFVGLRAELKELRDRNKAIIERYLARANIASDISKDDHLLEFSPGSGFSFWQNPDMTFLDPDRIVCYQRRDGKGFAFCDAMIKLRLLHEFGGHGLQYQRSKLTMPRGMAVEDEDFFQPVHSVFAEGTATALEDVALRSMRRSKKRWGLSPEDLKIALVEKESYVHRKLPASLDGLFDMLESREDTTKRYPEKCKRTALARLSRVTGVKRYGVDFGLLDTLSLDDTLERLRYFFGQQRYQPLVRKMRKAGLKDDMIIAAISTGWWCDPEAQEEFIFKLLVPEMKKAA